MFTPFDEFDVQFDLKVLDSLGLASLAVLCCGMAKTCKIAFSINLLVFLCTAVHAQVILFISPGTLSVEFHSSCVIILNCCRMTMNRS